MRKCALILLVFLALIGTSAHAQDALSYNGILDDSSDQQTYPVTLKTGDAILITTTAQEDDNLDTVLKLYDPAGRIVAENDDADLLTYDSQITYIAPETGVYKVEVSRYDETTSGHYDLDVTIGMVTIFKYDVTLSGTELTEDTAHFRIHYTLSGVDAVTPTFLDATARAFEDMWQREIVQLGWPIPPGDGLMGGDDLYDVYISDLLGAGEEALGYMQTAAVVGDNPNTDALETYAAASYIVIDNDFHDVEYADGQDAATLMRTTAAHEFHHAIQDGFDALEPDDWLREATSVWMETVAAGKDQDATGYIALAFEYPELCLGTSANDGDVMYGEWTFMTFLTDEFGADAVRQLWDSLIDYDSFDGMGRMLATFDTDVPHEAVRYRLKNLARDYQLAPLFDATVWLEDTITAVGSWTPNGSGVQELGANYFDFAAPSGLYDVSLSGDDGQLQLWAVGLTDHDLEAVALGRGGSIDSSRYSKLYLMVFNPQVEADVNDCSYVEYKIKVLAGKGSPNPVDSTWDSTYFEPLN